MDTNQGQALALAIDSLRRCKEDFAEVKKDYAARIEGLENRVSQISRDILTGQNPLPLEPTEPRITEVLEHVAAEVNSGALDTPTCKVTATIGESHA